MNEWMDLNIIIIQFLNPIDHLDTYVITVILCVCFIAVGNWNYNWAKLICVITKINFGAILMYLLLFGRAFRITGPSWGNPPNIGGLPSLKAGIQSFGIFVVASKSSLFKNSRLASDIRRLNTHMTSLPAWRN